MKATNETAKITIREIADTLGWNYEATKQIRARKSPAGKYQLLKECERNLIAAKQTVKKQFQNQ